MQHLLDQVQWGARHYSSAYIDDVVVYSLTWEQHLVCVRCFGAAEKCAMAQLEGHSLRHVIGDRAIIP